MLQAVRIKPNPAGKDRTRTGTTPSQLAAEWVDLQNTGPQSINLATVMLKHVAYRPGAANEYWEPVFTFNHGILGPGQSVRIHAGRARELSVIRPEDMAGATYHLFFGEDRFVWNNDRADCPSLWVPGRSQPFDAAWYTANPPEGAVLKRVNDAFWA